MQTIGFIGVGVMGRSMVKNLLKAGYEVAIYSRTKSKLTDFLEETGVQWCDTAAECAAGRDAVITMVGYPKDVEQVFGPGGAYEALAEARAAGKIGHIGATAHNADVLKKLVEEHGDKLETVMFPFNIVETQGREVLDLARSKGIGTIAMKPLAGGNLDDWELALRYVAQAACIDISIPGMGSPEEVERNAAVELTAPLNPEELERCAAVRRALGSQFCRRCGYCAPCTVGIDIPSNFLMANYRRKYGLSDWAVSRYQGLAHHAGECVKCGVCESRCPYELPIREMLKGVAAEFGY